MTVSDLPATSASLPAPGSWALRRNQLVGLVRLELRKNVVSARSLPLLFLGAFMVGLLMLSVLLGGDFDEEISAAQVFAGIYRFYFLKVAIFLGCLVTFTQLFRGDVLDRSLHYYFLSPLRREVLVASKFLVGLITTSTVLVSSTVLCFVLTYLNSSREGAFSAFGDLLTYAGITFLGCLGYGALFMVAGLLTKNAVIPALALFLWELLNPFLPVLLKKISIIHYLVSLLPVPLPFGPFEVLTEPTSPLISVPGLLLVALAAIALASLRIRKMEISYSDD